ncbi:MAG: hypothetical protein AAFW89_01010 [Bacteroidota bacterium]
MKTDQYALNDYPSIADQIADQLGLIPDGLNTDSRRNVNLVHKQHEVI